LFIVGNKLDLEEGREVTKADGEKFAAEHNGFFREVSALNGDGVSELFKDIAVEMSKMKVAAEGVTGLTLGNGEEKPGCGC
jgi:GTPase involved in cell partitioning and DNA repair